MAIRLGYALSPHQEIDAMETSSVERRHLTYNLFLSRITFQIDDCDLSPPWDWVPVLGFASAMARVLRGLRQFETSEYLFDGNDHRIRWQRDALLVTVSATYSDCTATCGFADYDAAMTDFVARTFREMGRFDPIVGKSAAFNALKSTAAAR